MRKTIFSLSLFFIFIILTSAITIPNNSATNANPLYYVIKVLVEDTGVYVRCEGPNFLECCPSCNYQCAFYPESTGTYTVCACKNNRLGTQTVNVVSGTGSYDVHITFTQQGACVTCPQEK